MLEECSAGQFNKNLLACRPKGGAAQQIRPKYKRLTFNKWSKMAVNTPFSMLMLGKGAADARVTCQTVNHATHPPVLCALSDTLALCFPLEPGPAWLIKSLSPKINHTLWGIDSDYEHRCPSDLTQLCAWLEFHLRLWKAGGK